MTPSHDPLDASDPVEQSPADVALTRALGGAPVVPPSDQGEVWRVVAKTVEHTGTAARLVRRHRFNSTHPNSTPPNASTRLLRGFGAWATCLIVGIGLWQGKSWWRSNAERLDETRTYRTGPRERVSFTLADGSQMTLAAQTTARVTVGEVNERVIELDGHAYFRVSPTSRRPFSVRTGQVTTCVLGTAFDVTHYVDDPEVRVAVVSGRVAIEAAHGARRVLVAGDLARITDSSATVVSDGDLLSYTRWTTGSLDFRGVPVADILKTLEHWYGVHFVLTDSVLAGQRVTTLLDDTRMTDVLMTLETVLEVTATSKVMPNGTVITLTPRRTSRSRPTIDRSRHAYSPVAEVGR